MLLLWINFRSCLLQTGFTLQTSNYNGTSRWFRSVTHTYDFWAHWRENISRIVIVISDKLCRRFTLVHRIAAICWSLLMQVFLGNYHIDLWLILLILIEIDRNCMLDSNCNWWETVLMTAISLMMIDRQLLNCNMMRLWMILRCRCVVIVMQWELLLLRTIGGWSSGLQEPAHRSSTFILSLVMMLSGYLLKITASSIDTSTIHLMTDLGHLTSCATSTIASA